MSSNSSPKEGSERIDRILLSEYSEARVHALHQDTITWQIGSILIAGSLASIGISIANLRTPKGPLGGALTLLAAMVSLACWGLILRRNRDFFRIYIRRMLEIEDMLGMKTQHYVELAQKNGCVQIADECVILHGPKGWPIIRFLIVTLIVLLGFAFVVLLNLVPMFS